MSKQRVMTHMVAFYPDRAGSLAAARGLIDGGTAYIELQFPFSDPTADGPVIQAACSGALEAGFSLSAGFELAREILTLADIPLFIMTYANPVIAVGVEEFIRRVKACGASGLIVPDLVPGADEGLYAAGKLAGLPIVPVVVPSIGAERMAEIAALGEEYLYTALRRGITGRETLIDAETTAFLESCGKANMKILAGFGIRNSVQIRALAPYVHAPVVGSALVEAITHAAGGSADDIYRNVRDTTLQLCGI